MSAAADYLHYIDGVNPLGKVYLSNMKAFGASNSVDRFYHTWFAHGSPLWGSVSGSKYRPSARLPRGRCQSALHMGQGVPESRPGAAGWRRPHPPFGEAARKGVCRFQRWLANRFLGSDRAIGFLPNCLHSVAGPVRPLAIWRAKPRIRRYWPAAANSSVNCESFWDKQSWECRL